MLISSEPLWIQIADEWLNRGYHYEDLGDGRVRIWYDGVVRSWTRNNPPIPLPITQFIQASDKRIDEYDGSPLPRNI